MLFKRRKRKARRVLAKSDINVTPLIDVLLVLLVIFMVISPTARTGLRTLIPQPASGVEAKSENVIVLSVDGSNTVRINREEIDLPALMPRLQDILKARSDRTVFVQADDALLFNDVAQVIDVAKGAGADRIGLMTGQIQGGTR